MRNVFRCVYIPIYAHRTSSRSTVLPPASFLFLYLYFFYIFRANFSFVCVPFYERRRRRSWKTFSEMAFSISWASRPPLRRRERTAGNSPHRPERNPAGVRNNVHFYFILFFGSISFYFLTFPSLPLFLIRESERGFFWGQGEKPGRGRTTIA